MHHSRFLVLTGHLNDYPLSDLVGILRHQQKTGRLLIEYPNNPASFFFHEGQLVDAQLDNLSGLQAVCVALAQPPSSFNFNPLIRPTRQSIENSLQKVVSELLGCWSDNEIEVEKIARIDQLRQPVLLGSRSASLDNRPQTNLDRTSTFLSLAAAPATRYRELILAMAAAGLLLLGLSTVIAVTGGFGRRDLSTAVAAPSRQTNDDSAVPRNTEGQSQNLPNTEFANNSRVQVTVAKGRDAALSLEPPTRQENRNPSLHKKEISSLEQTGLVSLPAKPDTKAHEEQTNEAPGETHAVRVVLLIEGGRVAQASIANRRSGMEAYEALALRIARQRRYPSKGSTQETITIKVGSP